MVAPPPHDQPGARLPSLVARSPGADQAERGHGGSPSRPADRPGIPDRSDTDTSIDAHDGPRLCRRGPPHRHALAAARPLSRKLRHARRAAAAALAAFYRSLSPCPRRSRRILRAARRALRGAAQRDLCRRQGSAVAHGDCARPRDRPGARRSGIARRGADPRRRRPGAAARDDLGLVPAGTIPGRGGAPPCRARCRARRPFADPGGLSAPRLSPPLHRRDDAPLSAFAGHAPHRRRG